MDKAALTQALTGITAGLADVSGQLSKGFNEVSTALGNLSGTETTPEQDAMISAIQSTISKMKAITQSLDDLVPDAPVVADSNGDAPPADGGTPTP